MDDRAEQLRDAALGHHSAESGRLVVEQDEAERRQAMARLGADRATTDMTDAQRAAAVEADTARRLELDAIAAQRGGDAARAEDLFEQAALHRSQQAVHQRRSDAAFAERQRLQHEVDEQGVRSQGARNELRLVATSTERQVRWAEDLDDRAELVQQSAAAEAAGDHQRAAELADQALIELVDEPTDFVGDLSAGSVARSPSTTSTPPTPNPTPPPAPLDPPDADRRPFVSPNPGPFGVRTDPPGGDADIVASVDPGPADGPADDPVIESQQPDLEPEAVADAGTDLADGALDA